MMKPSAGKEGSKMENAVKKVVPTDPAKTVNLQELYNGIQPISGDDKQFD